MGTFRSVHSTELSQVSPHMRPGYNCSQQGALKGHHSEYNCSQQGALKGQKLLAQGIVLGMMCAGLAP